MSNDNLPKIKNQVQNKESVAWIKLCEAIERIAEEGKDEFSPKEEIGAELFSQIYTLPESIHKLKKVKKIWLYGSSLKRIPPEIGEMENLEYFDPYTSYDLKWFPYEILECKKLIDSRVSTRALFGNYKNRKPFPDLTNNPVRYESENVKCSICKKEMTYEETNQLWISLEVGTDILPLLANVCSKECEEKIPKGGEGYVAKPHKGGHNLKQSYPQFGLEMTPNFIKLEEQRKLENEKNGNSGFLKLIRKIWEK